MDRINIKCLELERLEIELNNCQTFQEVQDVLLEVINNHNEKLQMVNDRMAELIGPLGIEDSV